MGIRIEELTELSHHSLIHYRLPATGYRVGAELVIHRSSMAVTCGVAGRRPSGMIAGRGGSTALSRLSAGDGLVRAIGP
jgi:hypothetical protein